MKSLPLVLRLVVVGYNKTALDLCNLASKMFQVQCNYSHQAMWNGWKAMVICNLGPGKPRLGYVPVTVEEKVFVLSALNSGALKNN